MTTIPEFMPILSGGKHGGPSEGACVMEMVSFLAGERWSDFPACTNRSIAKAAQYINDMLDDSVRAELMLPLIPRLMQTSQATWGLDHDLETRWLDLLDTVRITADHLAEKNGHYPCSADWLSDLSEAVRKVGYPRLVAMLDYYDQATGRQSKAELPDTDTLRRMAELTGASK